MVDMDLKDYIHTLLKQGYDIEDIKTHLAKAGHDMRKVEDLSLSVFKVFHKDLFEYIEKESKNGKNIDEIRKELLKIGHEEKKIKQIISYHRKGKSIYEKVNLHEIYHEEKKWIDSWMKILILVFIGILLFLSILTIPVVMQKNIENKEYADNMAVCQSMVTGQNAANEISQTFNAICRAFVEDDINMCNILPDFTDDCKDAYYYYSFLKTKESGLCDNIKDSSILELCKQIDERNCNNYYGYEAQCLSIVENSPTKCDVSGQTQNILMGNCRDQYNLYVAIKSENYEGCTKVNNINLNGICKVMI